MPIGELSQAIVTYLKARGSKTLSEVVGVNSSFLGLAKYNNLLGWDSFLEGRVSFMYQCLMKDVLKDCESVYIYQCRAGRQTSLKSYCWSRTNSGASGMQRFILNYMMA
jgi:hypothetical protein